MKKTDELLNNNEVSEQKRKRIQYNLSYPLPEVRSNLDRDKKIIRAFVTASDFGGKFVGRKDVAIFTDINEQIVGGILTFFHKIDLAEKEGNKYKPSLELINFENELKYESEEVAGEALKPLIMKAWFGEMAAKIFYSSGNSLPREDLFKRLGKMAGADPEYHKNAIYHLIGYLVFSRVVLYDDEKLIYTLNDVVDANQIESDVIHTVKDESIITAAEESIERVEGISLPKMANSVTQHNEKQLSRSNITININLNVNDTSDPQHIQGIMKVIVDELKEL